MVALYPQSHRRIVIIIIKLVGQYFFCYFFCVGEQLLDRPIKHDHYARGGGAQKKKKKTFRLYEISIFIYFPSSYFTTRHKTPWHVMYIITYAQSGQCGRGQLFYFPVPVRK